ncbi:GntP family permease [Faecalicatena contorta]|uniref:GntP family permease n=1 Tax=Faecalicatena contorta TaxID=39482 RepID=UPI00129E739B|nr:GntP family permease [Faecalicatena contorta]MRM89720.1 GntP family permease [Faecalicatena contorta]
MNIGLIGILIALAVLMFLVYKRINIILVSIFCCIIVALTSQLPVLETLKDEYMPGMTQFVTSNFLLFVFSAIFGKLMEESGAAFSFAKLIFKAFGARWAIYGGMIATALLVYGGVSNFVVVFTVFPIFLHIFKQANLPIRLIPGVIYAAGVTFAASMLPGTPSLNNIIPTQYIDTTPMAAPIVGLAASAVTIILIFLYFEYEFRRARQKGEIYQANEKASMQLERMNTLKEANPILSILPMAALVITLNVFKLDILYCLLISIFLVFALFYKNIGNTALTCVNEGISSASSAILNSAAAVGFGSVVKVTAGFTAMVNALMGFGGNPMVSLGIITTIISGITGSGTGGVGITMQVFAQKYLELGVNPEILHRIVAIASNGLDSLPHNGLVITVILACGCTHKESYKPILVTSVIITIIALAITIIMGIAMYPLAI